MDNVILHTSSYEDLVRIVNSLILKINELEKKISVLQHNSELNNFHNEVILHENVFRSIPPNAPKLTRQNAFPINL